LGSARDSRAGFGVPPKRTFRNRSLLLKVRDSEDAVASTREACATQNPLAARNEAS